MQLNPHQPPRRSINLETPDFLNSVGTAVGGRSYALEMNPGEAAHHCEHCGKFSPIGLDVFDATETEFWDTFRDEEDRWTEALLEWAADDRELAVVLWKMAIENDCAEVLALDALRAQVEQHEIDLTTPGKNAARDAKTSNRL